MAWSGGPKKVKPVKATDAHLGFRAIAVLATSVLLVGCVSHATKTPTTGRAATTQASTAGGMVNIVDYADNDGPKSTVILTGAIGDYGEALSIHPDGTVDPEHNSELNLALTHGSFRLSIAGLDKRIVSAFSHFPANTSTCSGTVTESGTTPIVAGSGTGAYSGISGSFKMTATIAEVDT